MAFKILNKNLKNIFLSNLKYINFSHYKNELKK
jgi:hypothetical protein